MEFGLVHIWQTMGWTAKLVIILLAIMSVYSIGLGIERWLTYRAAKKQSLAYAMKATQLLKQNKMNDLIEASKGFKKSHLAKVVSAGLYEFLHESGNPAGGSNYDHVEAAKRAVDNAASMTVAEFRKGLSGLATIGSTAPFIGLFGTVVGIINAFRGMAETGSGGLGAVSAGIAEALVATAFGLFVAIPAVWMFNYFINKVERFNVEMANSGNEIVGYFIKLGGGTHAGGIK